MFDGGFSSSRLEKPCSKLLQRVTNLRNVFPVFVLLGNVLRNFRNGPVVVENEHPDPRRIYSLVDTYSMEVV